MLGYKFDELTQVKYVIDPYKYIKFSFQSFKKFLTLLVFIKFSIATFSFYF